MTGGLRRAGANIITSVRIMLSLALLGLLDRPAAFVVVLILAGLSDVLDGVVARKFHSSLLGAKLDSWADMLLYIVITYSLWLKAGGALNPLVPYALLIVGIRGFSAGISWLRYGKPVFIHTWLNKLTGLIVFLVAVLYFSLGRTAVFWIAIGLAIAAALEEAIINLIAPEADVNRRSLFF